MARCRRYLYYVLVDCTEWQSSGGLWHLRALVWFPINLLLADPCVLFRFYTFFSLLLCFCAAATTGACLESASLSNAVGTVGSGTAREASLGLVHIAAVNSGAGGGGKGAGTGGEQGHERAMRSICILDW
ncbi:hypothetical protein OOU_Y34scaffold00126g104 [Pyricularia oryzae Y34]|uniref:Uncharacterized protein n=2 Tax=Pyricularia oryzae TaxID=318829 RepID=A0AA97P8L9_PYRO3|nr:hypothetical protein OOU_Y34scaffold00126g104 [Pyricularia oryzae Y34]